jgi:hypothetical protein
MRVLCFILLALLSSCGQKTIIEIPGGNNTVTVSITAPVDKQIDVSPNAAVSSGMAQVGK